MCERECIRGVVTIPSSVYNSKKGWDVRFDSSTEQPAGENVCGCSQAVTGGSVGRCVGGRITVERSVCHCWAHSFGSPSAGRRPFWFPAPISMVWPAWIQSAWWPSVPSRVRESLPSPVLGLATTIHSHSGLASVVLFVTNHTRKCAYICKLPS